VRSRHIAPTEIYTLSLHDALPISSANVQIAAGETWALASEAIAAPYRTTTTAIVYRPFDEPPIPCWIALVWRPNERDPAGDRGRSEEHTSELQSRENLVCRLLLEK